MTEARPIFPWKLLNGQSFQALCAGLLLEEGYQVSDQGIGPDGGIDIIAIQNISLDAHYAKSYKWAVQVKYKSNPSATVSPKELGNLGNLLARFQADGFLLVTNAQITAKAFAEIRAITVGGPPSYLANVWDKRVVEAKLLRNMDLRRRYFPREERIVLFVDDEPMFLRAYASILSAVGFRVFTAVNLVDALEIAREHTIDVAVLDIRLDDPSDYSGMSGIDLARRIRELQPAVRLIFHSAYLATDFIRAIASLQNAVVLSKFDTDSKQLREAVEHAVEPPKGIAREAAQFRVMSTLLGASLHRLTNKLRSARLLLEEIEDEEIKIYVKDALDSSFSIIRRLMHEATSGGLEYATALFDSLNLLEIIKEAIKAVGEIHRHTQIQVSTEVNAIKVQGNQHAIEAMLVSLIENAVESKEGGGVEVAVRVQLLQREKDFAVVAITDNGGGIAPDLLPRLFEAGFTSKREGSGMGLFLSSKVAEYHGGWIEVESPAGRWSTEVRLIIPCDSTIPASRQDVEAGLLGPNLSATPDANRASRGHRR